MTRQTTTTAKLVLYANDEDEYVVILVDEDEENLCTPGYVIRAAVAIVDYQNLLSAFPTDRLLHE